MTIVVDIGSSERAGEDSAEALIRRFQPTLYYGFDPDPDGLNGTAKIDGVREITFSRSAAWTHNGWIGFKESGVDGIRSFTGEGIGMAVDCFDLAEFLFDLPEKVVLKLDCEGCEYELIPHLIETGAIGKVELLLVEWHKDGGGVLETNGVAPIHVPVPWELWG